MQTYPAARCQHLKVNGTQCGSPALRNHRFCFFHQQWRTKRLRIDPNATRRPASITLPVLEDANSIQVAVMQVTRLLLAGQIEHKTASLALYALQIASSNLARTEFEASRPTKVVVDRDKVAETPLGATPWAAKGKGHEPEDDEEFEYEESESERFPSLERLRLYRDASEEEHEDRNQDRDGSDHLPPGTIQACRAPRAHVSKSAERAAPSAGGQHLPRNLNERADNHVGAPHLAVSRCGNSSTQSAGTFSPSSTTGSPPGSLQACRERRRWVV